MEPHHFTFASSFSCIKHTIPPSEELIFEVAEAFFDNMKRVNAIGVLPMFLVALAATNESLCANARRNIGIGFDDPLYGLNSSEMPPEIGTRLDAEEDRIRLSILERSKKGTMVGPVKLGTMQLASVITDSHIIEGLDAILSAMIVGTWTAVETLVSDLWRTALNVHPVKLAALAGKWHKPPKDTNIEDEAEPSDKRTIRLEELGKRGYDLSKEMGTVLRGRYKWGVLESVRNAYGEAFSSKFDGIITAIEHPSLDAMSATRNVLVHKAGVVDAEFLKKNRAWPGFANAEIGKSLQLNGIVVRDLIIPVHENAINLTNAVGAWLRNN